jgi:serine/threonine protein kinase
LKHPNILKLVEYFEEEGDLYLVQEYINGKSTET